MLKVRSRCSLDSRKRAAKPSSPTACIFCCQRLLHCNAYLPLTMKAIFELQNHVYTKITNGIVEEVRQDASCIAFKDHRGFCNEKELLEEYICRNTLREKAQQIIEFYKYYQDLPRIFIEKAERVLSSHHIAKRYIFYRGLKRHLGFEQPVRTVQRDNKKEQNLLGDIYRDEEETEGSLSWSVLLMQKKLAKAIKNTNTTATPRTQLERIDRQYTFTRLINPNPNIHNIHNPNPYHPNNHPTDQPIRTQSFDGLSNIYDPKSLKPSQLNSPFKIDFRKMFTKKKQHKQLVTNKYKPLVKPKNHHKQRSMEDIRRISKSPPLQLPCRQHICDSVTTSSFKSSTPLRKMAELASQKLKSGHRVDNKADKVYVSQDISYLPHHKINSSHQRNETRGHQRLASQQLEKCKKLGGNWTPIGERIDRVEKVAKVEKVEKVVKGEKGERMRITINQQSVVQILVNQPQRSKILKKGRR